jgi:hypothetical protein
MHRPPDEHVGGAVSGTNSVPRVPLRQSDSNVRCATVRGWHPPRCAKRARLQWMSRSETKAKILACLKCGEKSLLEVFRQTEKVGYTSVRNVMVRLYREGVLERRLEQSPESKNRLRHLYRFKP